MIEVKKEGIVLKRTDLAFEQEGVLNPAVIMEKGIVHFFYRAVAKGNYSSIGYCKLEGPLRVTHRNPIPLIVPEFDYESHGVEDARIVKIDGLYYLSYTAYDGVNAVGALAVSKDLVHFEKIGVVTPQMTMEAFHTLSAAMGPIRDRYLLYNRRSPALEELATKLLVWDKNLIFFPRRIHGKLYFLHRVKPDIQLVAVQELSDLTKEFWNTYFLQLEENILLSSKYDHEISYLGGGCPPIETKEGWLIIYHGVHATATGYVYSACAAVLDLENPHREIARLPYPLFVPEFPWELKGVVNNVCFPTGAVEIEDRLYIYYGAADKQIACASLSIIELLAELMLNETENESQSPFPSGRPIDVRPETIYGYPTFQGRKAQPDDRGTLHYDISSSGMRYSHIFPRLVRGAEPQVWRIVQTPHLPDRDGHRGPYLFA